MGLVAHLKMSASRDIVEDANQMLVRMSHRGGCGCEPNSGDGAGTFFHANAPCTDELCACVCVNATPPSLRCAESTPLMRISPASRPQPCAAMLMK